jgi:hypothetical protein
LNAFSSSVRPGLVPDKIAKQLQREKKEKEANLKSKTKPLKVIEHELQKMGYKQGMSLGKEGSLPR